MNQCYNYYCTCPLPASTGPQFLEGVLYCSNDPGAVYDALACGFAIIAVVDVDEAYRFSNMPNTVVMSSLLPPSEAISAFINQDPIAGESIYYQYLANVDREEAIVCILKALYGHRARTKTNKFLLYTDLEPDMEFHISKVLHLFFLDTFGIYIAPYKYQNMKSFNISNPEYNFRICTLLFENNMITKEEYAMMLPPDALPSDKCVAILLQEINCMPSCINDAMRICCQYIQQIRDKINTGKTEPFILFKQKMEDQLEKKITKRVMESDTRFG